MIKIEHVKKNFGHLEVLHDVSLTVDDGNVNDQSVEIG